MQEADWSAMESLEEELAKLDMEHAKNDGDVSSGESAAESAEDNTVRFELVLGLLPKIHNRSLIISNFSQSIIDQSQKYLQYLDSSTIRSFLNLRI